MNLKTIKTVILSILLLILAYACSSPVTYYISAEGDDSKSGRSEEKAWRTIEKANSLDLATGDQVRFRGGDVFDGTIILTAEDSGNESSRVVITSFGEGKALIQGGEAEGLRADSCTFLTIENMDFTGLGRKTGNGTDGVLIRNCDEVVINNLEISGFQHSGLHLQRCNDASITYVHANENGFAGIHVTGVTMNDPEKYDNHRLYIGYCVAENNPGDPTVLKGHSGNGILASSVSEGTIEYCEAFNNGWDMPWTGNGPVGIWIWDCTEFTIQYCIAHHNRTNPVAADGGGFDFDGGVSNSVIQYCISHNNEGAGFGLYEFGAAKPWENNTIRYNISQDDGIINAGSMGIWKNDEGGVMRNCDIYNNTFYNSLEEGSNLWLYDNYPGFRFRNNVFVYNGSLTKGGKTIKDEVFQGNLYWNLTGEEPFEGYKSLVEWAEATGQESVEGRFAGFYLEPQFQNAGSLEVTDPEMIVPETLSGYIPVAGSPLVNNGLDLKKLFETEPGFHDILGTPLPVDGNYDIGAVERIGP